MPNGGTNHPNPYPDAVDLRLRQLEEWKREQERKETSSTIRLLQHEIKSARDDINWLRERQRTTDAFMSAAKGGSTRLKDLLYGLVVLAAFLAIAAPYIFGGN